MRGAAAVALLLLASPAAAQTSGVGGGPITLGSSTTITPRSTRCTVRRRARGARPGHRLAPARTLNLQFLAPARAIKGFIRASHRQLCRPRRTAKLKDFTCSSRAMTP